MRYRVIAAAIQMALVSSFSYAQTSKPLKIGVLTDMSGLYADMSGQGSVEAVKLAIEDVGGKVLGLPVELVSADHGNKADIGGAIARRWYEAENVDVIVDVPTSSVALGVAALAAQEKKAVLFSTAVSERLTEDACTPYTLSWTYNNYAITNSLVSGLVGKGANTWFILAPNYAYGKTTAEAVAQMVESKGGKVVGTVFHPLNGDDFSSFLLQAQASKAEVIAIASGGHDLQNLLKQANEFQLFKSGAQKPVMLNNIISDTKGVGLEMMKGIRSITPFYWDRTDQTRAFAKRFSEKVGRVPGETQGGTYSAVLNYLKAVEATGTKDPVKVFAYLRENKIEDMFAVNAQLRPNGQLVHDMYLVETKKPEESKSPWDLYKVLSTIPAQQAFRPLAETTCPFIKK